MVPEHLCFKTHWFHNEWIRIPLLVFLLIAEKKLEQQGISAYGIKTRSWGVGRTPSKPREGKLEVIFLWGLPQKLCSICASLGWNDSARVVLSVKDKNLTGWRGWKSPFSPFPWRNVYLSCRYLYPGAVVCQISLREEISGILLFCGTVQLGSDALGWLP